MLLMMIQVAVEPHNITMAFLNETLSDLSALMMIPSFAEIKTWEAIVVDTTTPIEAWVV